MDEKPGTSVALNVKLRAEWLSELQVQFASPAMKALSRFLREEKAQGKAIFPPGPDIFRALESTPPEQVRVVVLGQDPYHGAGQAHGLSFSVRRGVPVPPSLRNIFKEIQRDLDVPPPTHGCLDHWAEQGVLLLNTVLTVESGRPGSHQNMGWEAFTDRIVEVVRDSGVPTVFMLWGAHARKKAGHIDSGIHQVLTAPHPSPLSAHRGFLGCNHFSLANAFLLENGRGSIDWRLPS